MKALLLAAGYGKRLRPLTEQIPKCLVPIREQPLLAYWLNLLLPNAIEHILINTHYLAKQVEKFVKNSSWAHAITLVHETELLGTGGTILNNRDFFAEEAFLLAHADNLTRFDVEAFKTAHQQRKKDVEITMMTFDTDAPESCGIVELDHDKVVIEFHEKSKIYKGTRANAAVYILEPSVIHFLASLNKKVIDMSTEVLPHYLGRIQTYHNAEYHRDIGTQESLRLAQIEYHF